MNKKWLTVMIALFVVVAIIGVGGKVYMDKKEEAEKIEAERMSVKALKNTFADIKSVEFEQSAYNKMTGSYRMFVRMTNKSGESVKFSYSYWKQSNEIGSYGVEDKEIQVEGVTKNKIYVVYSNNREEET